MKIYIDRDVISNSMIWLNLCEWGLQGGIDEKIQTWKMRGE